MKINILLEGMRRMKHGSIICVWAGFISVYWSMPAAAQAVYSTPYTFITLAGKTISGNVTDTNGGVQFVDPRGLAVDASGNVYVADTRNHTICRMTPAGDMTILAGKAGSAGSTDGTGGTARFRYPQSVAVDGAGNIYVADSGNDTIRRVTPVGVVTTLAGRAQQAGSADGMGGAARFNYPNSVALDSTGNVYVADLYNVTIRKVTPAGAVTTLAGQAGCTGSADGQGNAARFDYPVGVAVDNADNVYVADIFNNAIRKVTATGVVTTLAGGLAYKTGNVDGAGKVAQFSHPGGVAVDSAQNVYVTDTDNQTIRRVTPAGVVTTLAGLAEHAGNADGTGNAARFRHPMGIALDPAGNIYVADLCNAAIRKGFPAGAVPALVLRTSRESFSLTTP